MRVYILGIIVLAALQGCSSDNNGSGSMTASEVPNPLVTLASGGRERPSGGLRYDVTQFGYEEREYFFEGSAKTYSSSGDPSAAYRSRMIVWTPKDPSRFNGTTVVEWGHVSVGGFELNAELSVQSSMLIDEGFAFVLVSAHEEGICGGGTEGCGESSLKGVDPERYSSLEHPGEDYSFDIFNQALQAIKYPSGTAPLGELATRFIIAEGFQPQFDRGDPVQVNDSPDAAGPLNAYIASEASQVRLADAFLLDSAAPLVEPAEYPGPTLHHLDESAIRRTPAPNSANHVTWEVIGAPHVDRWAADYYALTSIGEISPLWSREEEEARRIVFDNYGQLPDANQTICAPIWRLGTVFPRHYTLDAAIVALREWLETGIPASAPPHIERVVPTPVAGNMKLSRDADGNAIGGLRLPIVQVPVATYNGEGCVFAGTSVPLPSERLAELYPTHRSYVEQLLAATNEAVDSRLLRCHDAEKIMRSASDSTIGGNDAFTAEPACAQ